MKKTLISAAIALAFGMNAAYAQTTTPPTTTPIRRRGARQ